MNATLNYTRWVLGFDGGCSECSHIAGRIAALSEGNVSVESLNSADVTAWRQQVFGTEAAYRPTLLAIDGESVQAWTGARMAMKLTQLAGPISAWAVLREFRALEAAHDRDKVDDPSRRRAIEFSAKMGAAIGLVALGHSTTPTSVGAQIEAARIGDTFRGLRLELANRREQAKLAQRWKLGKEERAFIGWLNSKGYRPAEGGKMFFYLVYRRGRLERRVVARAWQKGRNEGAVVLMSLEGNREVWKGLTFVGDRPLLRLSVNRIGKIDTERLNAGRMAMAAQDTDSGECNTCEVLATLLATGVIVFGSFGCWLGCASATVATLGIATGPCASICIALTTYGVVTGAPGAPGTCQNLGFCSPPIYGPPIPVA